MLFFPLMYVCPIGDFVASFVKLFILKIHGIIGDVDTIDDIVGVVDGIDSIIDVADRIDDILGVV